MPTKWYKSTIVEIEKMTRTTWRFWLEVETEEPLVFIPGQFITMDLPIHEKRTKRWRSYSIANVPDQSNILELCIVYLDGGAASHYLFKEVIVGTPIRFKGPSGAFTLPSEINKHLVFICTGTGVAPFRSMLLAMQQQEIPHKDIHLIFGTRTKEGLLYRNEFEALAAKVPSFSYSVALSREEDTAIQALPFDAYKGYVHQIYQKHYEVVNADVHFYLCGWQNMIDEAVETLIHEMGVDRRQIFYELYG